MEKFKTGDRVIGTKIYSRTRGKKGTVLCVKKHITSVEFDDNIDGHSCPNEEVSGKEHHCWNCELDQLELISSEPNYEIY